MTPDDIDDGPYVCPGCYAIGEAPCAPGCIDAEIAARDEHDRETRDMAEWDGEYDDNDEAWP